jgi:hypothetical protein
VVGVLASAWVLTWCVIGVASAAQDSPTIAFLGFQIINTSVEPIKEEEQQRLETLNTLFLEQVDGSHRFKVVPVPLMFCNKSPMVPLLLTATVASAIMVRG